MSISFLSREGVWILSSSNFKAEQCVMFTSFPCAVTRHLKSEYIEMVQVTAAPCVLSLSTLQMVTGSSAGLSTHSPPTGKVSNACRSLMLICHDIKLMIVDINVSYIAYASRTAVIV